MLLIAIVGVPANNPRRYQGVTDSIAVICNAATLVLPFVTKTFAMLADKKLKAFVPTVDPEKAKLFYRDVLGLKLLSQDNYALEFEANGMLLNAIVGVLTNNPGSSILADNRV